MLEHLDSSGGAPDRVIVLGARGFVGAAAADRLEADGIQVLRLTRGEIDLFADDADTALSSEFRPTDTVVMVSAIAPAKNSTMMLDNIIMMKSVCQALREKPVAHVIYISSDAVYADSSSPLTEASCMAPASFHGMMHAVREFMIADAAGDTPLAVLRPSLLYGAKDPHNGYGPNRFRRLAQAGEEIVLFGKGEERRDHVFIDDLAEIVRLVVRHKSRGALNVATGEVASFREIAEMVTSLFNFPPAIKETLRVGPMPHDGYRPFDISSCHAAFSGFRYTPLLEGLRSVHLSANKTS